MLIWFRTARFFALICPLGLIGCGPSFDQEAEYQRLIPLIEQGLAHWASAPRTGPSFPDEDAPYRMIAPMAESLEVLLDERWEALSNEERLEQDFVLLPALAMTPHYDSVVGRWIRERPEVSAGWNVLVEAMESGETAHGDGAGEQLGLGDFRSIGALCSLRIRHDLERGQHDLFFEGLAGLHRLGRVGLSGDGIGRRLASLLVFGCRFIGDELSRSSRAVTWTKADALRLMEMLDAALLDVVVSERAIRHRLWQSAEFALEGWSAESFQDGRQHRRSPEDVADFVGSEEVVMSEVLALLNIPLFQAVTRASSLQGKRRGTTIQSDFYGWVYAYFAAVAHVRSELMTLRLALAASLSGEPATMVSARGNRIRARIDGSFVLAEEEHLDEFTAWRVRVPLVAD